MDKALHLLWFKYDRAEFNGHLRSLAFSACTETTLGCIMSALQAEVKRGSFQQWTKVLQKPAFTSRCQDVRPYLFPDGTSENQEAFQDGWLRQQRFRKRAMDSADCRDQLLYLRKHQLPKLTHQQCVVLVNRNEKSNYYTFIKTRHSWSDFTVTAVFFSPFIFSITQLHSQYLYLPALFCAYLQKQSMITWSLPHMIVK